MLEPVAVVLALRLGDADRDHLRGIVPLVDRGGDVEALVALQADQPAAERRGQHLGDLGLADAGLAFEEQRPAHLERQIEHGAERAVGEIFGLGEKRDGGVDRGRQRAGRRLVHELNLARHAGFVPAIHVIPVAHGKATWQARST